MPFRRNASLLVLALPLLLGKPAYADVAWFDIDHDLLYVPAVTMGAATYPNVILRHLGDLRFALQAAGAPVSDADETSSSFDSASGILRIATALVGCTTYVDVALQIGGDFSFALLAATEKMPGTVGLALTVQPANANVKAGESARFTVGAIGPGPFSYQWLVDGVTVAGATDAAFSTAPLTVEDTGRVVTVRVSNGGGSLISAPATVAVASSNVVPDITADPVSFTSASLGSMPELSMQSRGNLPSYQWRRNGANIAGATGRVYSLPALTADDHLSWHSVFACSGSRCVTSQNAQVQVALPGMPAVTQLHAANNFSLAVRNDGTLWGWGESGVGTIGLARPTSAVTRQGHPAQGMCAPSTPLNDVLDAAGGFNHSLALRQDGTVWATGNGGFGALGDGTLGTQRGAFAPVQLADGGLLQNARSVAAGTGTSHAVTADGLAYAWGKNSDAQLGDGTSADRAAAVQIRDAAGVAITGVRSVSAGTVHTVWLKGDGTVWAAGSNGQLPVRPRQPHAVQIEAAAGVPLTKVVAIAAGATHTLALRSDGSVVGWGSNNFGQLAAAGQATYPLLARDAAGQPLSTVIAVAAGDGSSFFLLANGTVLAVGNNSDSRLGIGTVTSSTAVPTLVKHSSGAVFGGVVAITSRYSHALARRSDGSVWGWGRNSSLSLADGTTATRLTPVKVQGLTP